MSTSGVHIVVYPYPTAGHIIPLLDFTQRLLTRGLTVTVLVTANNLPLLDPYLTSHPSSLNHLVLPAPDIVPPQQRRLRAIARAIHDLHYPIILQWFRSQSSPPVAILSDFFLGWTHHLACELGIPRLVFSPSGAFALSVSFSVCRDPPKIDDPEDLPVSFPTVPNSPVYPSWQISPHFKIPKEQDPDWEFFINSMQANTVSWGLVINSFQELESAYFAHLKRELRNDRVWAVGPVLPLEDGNGDTPADRGGVSAVPCHEVVTWLDSRSDKSVVYVCFGSRSVLTGRQMDALAAALENSSVDFICVVKQPDARHAGGDHGAVPDGFEHRVHGRGFVIKGWAPQAAILRHRAVGAFLTHCGWNSTLEGLTAGLVMLTWPMDADQFTNAKLLVDQLGVGIRVGEGTRNIPEPKELSRLLRTSVEGGTPERARAKELSLAAITAVTGGSSDQALEELVRRLAELKK